MMLYMQYRNIGVRLTFLLFAFSVLAVAAGASTYLNVVGPVQATLINNQTVYLGKVGPGESFYVLANPNTTSPNGNYINIAWDTLKASGLPAGWSSQASPLYENPMKMKITVSPNAPYGRYNLSIEAVNVYSGIGNLTFVGQVNVSPNVFALRVSPGSLSAGIGQPSNLYISINNTGISDDPFIISAQGLPAWNLSEEVISLHSTNNRFTYPVFADQPGVYPLNLTVYSASSPLINESYHINFIVKESLLNDYKAVGSGISLSPVVFEPAYAFMSFLAYVYGLAFH